MRKAGLWQCGVAASVLCPMWGWENVEFSAVLPYPNTQQKLRDRAVGPWQREAYI